MDQTQVIADFLRMLRRRAALLIGISALGMAASVVYALKQPAVYETSAKILVESQQISTDLARSTVNMSSIERLQLIEQRLTSRNYLVSVIEEFGLFSEAPGLTINEKIELLRAAIRVESILVSGQDRTGDTEIFAFTITMRHGDAEQAADIVNTFVETAVAENLRVRAERARDTRLYFEQQVARVADQVVALEGEISLFKHENEGALPESLEYRRDELARLQESVMEIDRRLLELEDEHLTMELALAGGAPLRTGELTPQSPEEAELRRLTLELAQKRRLLASDNPELTRLESRIAAIAELVPSGAVAAALDPDGPTPEQEGVLLRQSALLVQQIALLREQKETIDARRAALEASMQATPQIGVALNSLERRLGELQDQHSALVQRSAEARTGEELETNEQSERFRVVEDALAPDYPVEPSRKKIAALGSGLGIGLAFALVLVLEMMRPAIRTSNQMERQLGIRPVIAIPHVRTRWERRRRRLAWSTALVLVALGGGLALPFATEEGGAVEALAERVGMQGLLGVLRAEAGAAGVPAEVAPAPGAAPEAAVQPEASAQAAALPVAADAAAPAALLPLLFAAPADASGLGFGVTLAAGAAAELPAPGLPFAGAVAEPKLAAIAAEPLPVRPADPAAAEALFRQAVDLGLDAPEQTRTLYARAAALGHHRAAYYLGQIYETGDGVAADPALARAWYDVAAADTAEADAAPSAEAGAAPAGDEVGTAPAGAGAAALPEPLLALRQEDGTVALVWSRSAGETTYLVEFAATPEGPPRFRGEVTGQTLSVALPAEIRYWRVGPLRTGAAAWLPLDD